MNTDGCGEAARFAERFIAKLENGVPESLPERERFVFDRLSEIASFPFRDDLAAEPAFADFRPWCEVPFPPPQDVVAGFARVLEPQRPPPAPKIPLADFRESFSLRDRRMQLLGEAFGIAKSLFAMAAGHPLAALRLARDVAATRNSGLFDRDFYAWEHPETMAKRFASPLLHYCTEGWRKGWGFAPGVPSVPPDLLPLPENPLLAHVRLFGRGRRPTADTLRRLWRELRPDRWDETVRERLRAEAAPKPPLAVVVPVYNHPELLPPLVASLLEFTPPEVLLLFVENGSEDPAVRPALQRLAAENPGRVQVECLDENAGFAGACNHGIRAAGRRDAILLNNDTVVGPRWTDSLRLAAYADERIGTATAVSNNSGLASVPERGKNEMPPGLSVATVARGWLHAPETVFDLHVGHGFCLYLKRAMLDEVGEFDAAAFGKGYGEEADLCLRAWKKGWKHRITTRAFVWHLNAVSFGGRYKSFKVHVARHALVVRHPDLDALEDVNIPRWGAFCPMLRSVGESIRLDPPRPAVLLLAPSGKGDSFPEPFAAALRRSFDILALERMADGSAALHATARDGMVLETGSGTDDDLVSWTVEHGVELVLAADPALAGPALRARFAALHVPVLDGIAPALPGESPERAAARLGSRLASALSFAPDAPSGAPFAADKTRDIVLPPAPVPGAFDPAAFDRTDLSDVSEAVVDGLPLPVSDDARLLLLARLCGTRLRIRARTEEPRFWIDRAMPHFRLLAAADAIEKPNRPPLDGEFLPLFPKPPPPPPPDVLEERVAGYLRAKAARTAPARHVVYTAIAGDYESLKIPDSPDPDVDYVCFAPEPAADEGPWTCRPFAWTDEDPTRTARWHKLHGPELFPDAETVVWMDGNVTPLPGTEREIREKLLAGPNPIATLRHFDRDNVFDEAEACIERGKDDPALLRAQVARYRAAGLPEKHPFAETCIVASRPADPRARSVFATWWEELAAGSRRDQISLPFALWKNGADFTPLFDRDIRLAVDKVRFAGHARRNLRKTNADVPQTPMKRRLIPRPAFFRKRPEPAPRPATPENACPPPPTVQRLSGRAFVPFPRPEAGARLVFSHSGKIGDVVYSLPFCRAVAAAAGRDRFAFHLKTGTVVERTRANGSVARTPLFDDAGAALLAPLLRRQPYVESVAVSDCLPAGALDLDLFRLQTCLPLWGNSLPNYYLPLAPWLADPPDLSRPWLSGGRRLDLGKKKIALFLTGREPRKNFSFGFLEPFRDEILFLGTASEHSAFEKAFFPVDHRKIADFADALDVLSSIRLAIGNQTGFFAMAEAMKIPRLLLVPDGNANNVPCGGAFQLLYETESARQTFAAFHERFCR